MSTELATTTQNTALATTNKPKTIYDMVQQQTPGFKLALPEGYSADRFTRVAITAIRNNEKLQQCDPASILGCLMLAAQLGLEPNSPLQEAYIIPYNSKKGMVAQFQVGYRGLEKLAWNSGMLESINFNSICEFDEYEYVLGFENIFTHKINIRKPRGESIAYYAVAFIKGSGKILHLMTKDEIMNHAKKFSKTWNEQNKNFGGKYNIPSPWDTDFDAMALKTVLKLLIDKKLPKRTTDEALKFAYAAVSDSSVYRPSEKQIADFNSCRIDLTEMNTTPVNKIDDEMQLEENVEHQAVIESELKNTANEIKAKMASSKVDKPSNGNGNGKSTNPVAEDKARPYSPGDLKLKLNAKALKLKPEASWKVTAHELQQITSCLNIMCLGSVADAASIINHIFGKKSVDMLYSYEAQTIMQWAGFIPDNSEWVPSETVINEVNMLLTPPVSSDEDMYSSTFSTNRVR